MDLFQTIKGLQDELNRIDHLISILEEMSPAAPGRGPKSMSEDELLAKFRGCLEFGVGAKRADADKLADAVMNIDKATDAAATIVGAFPQSK